jgi:hypothetical protein
VQVENTGLLQTLPWSAAAIPLRAWQEAQAAARESDRRAVRTQIDEDVSAADWATSRDGRLTRIATAFYRRWALQEQDKYHRHNQIGFKPDDAHLAVAGMLLTDAVRRNGFNYSPFASRLQQRAAVRHSTITSQVNVERGVRAR